MLRSVWTKTLWDTRGGLAGWTAAAVGVAVLYAVFYPSIRQDAFAEAMAAFPEALMAAFGWDDLTSAAGYLGSTVFGLLTPVLLIIYAIGLGSRAVAGDEEAGTLELVLAHPVERTRLVLERALATVIALGVVALAVLLAMLAMRGPAQLQAIGVGELVAMCVHLALLGILFGSLALAVGAATGNRATAVGTASLVAVLGYFGNTIARQVEALSWAPALSPFAYYEGGDPLVNGLRLGDATVLLVASLVLVGVAVVGLRRRDVGV